jgi:hypothetical protein
MNSFLVVSIALLFVCVLSVILWTYHSRTLSKTNIVHVGRLVKNITDEAEAANKTTDALEAFTQVSSATARLKLLIDIYGKNDINELARVNVDDILTELATQRSTIASYLPTRK